MKSAINTLTDPDDISIDPSKVLWYIRLHPAVNPLWSGIISAINVAFCCLFITLAIKGVLFSYQEDIFFTAECLQTCSLMIHTIVKISVLFTHRTTFLQLLQEKSNFWKIQDFSGEIHDECSTIATTVKKMFRCYYFLNFVVCLCFDLQPFLTGYLPSGCYVPAGSYTYLMVFLWYLSCVVVLGVGGTDTCFCSIATSLVIQFKLLNHELKNIKPSENEFDTTPRNKVKRLTQYHVFLLSYCEKLNTMFRGVFLIQFLSAIASGALSVFIFMQPGAWVNRFKFLLYFLDTTIESAFYCVPLEFVINAANQIGDSVYESEWCEINDVHLKKSLRLLIAKSQKMMVFSAYGLIWINLRTFLVICKTVFSFYTYLNSARSISA
ncbi:hypothetical protein Zmor_000670 [Zophobas morio]|uniref:Odorant receptor n=1 Tax=Zophobas morio TaxID=2755281 RepID=A0AA38IXD6_9CUCU|nr:hypothetical protein Zmor_000670 [Zophobas morio]